METIVIEACAVLFAFYVWNAMCCLRCTAAVLFRSLAMVY